MKSPQANTSFLPLILLCLLSIIWGSSFILIKQGLRVFSPIEVMAIRVLIASSILSPLAVKSFKNIPKKYWKHIVVLGVIGNLAPAYLFAQAQTQIASSMAGMLNSITPIITLLMGLVFFKGQLVGKQVLGVILGFIGTISIIYFASHGDIGNVNWYALLVVAATFCYAFSTNTLKSHLSKQSVADITIAQLSIIGIPAVFILLFSDLPQTFQKEGAWEAFGYLGILAVFGTIIGIWLFNKITQLKSAIFAISVTYFIPFVAILFGVLSGETVQLEQIIGMALIIGGVLLINKSSAS